MATEAPQRANGGSRPRTPSPVGKDAAPRVPAPATEIDSSEKGKQAEQTTPSRSRQTEQAGSPASSSPGILPATHWTEAPIAPDESAESDYDSAFDESDAASSTASLSESILQYRTLHGRTYHSTLGNAESWIPNDDRHNESMDIHHHLCTLAIDGKLHLAPLKEDIQKVVDIGCGTGLWAIDFADAYPSAEVIGTDLSPIQPSWVPVNLRFELDDANLQWTWPEDNFDYVHMRGMFGSVTDWYALAREAYRCVKPGGWFEDYENSVKITSDDNTVAEGSPFDQWTKVFWEGGKKFGRTFRVVEEDLQIKAMEAAGFKNIVVKDVKVPIGPWPKDKALREMGQYAKLVLDTDLEGYVLYMWNAVMGWSREEIMVFMAHLLRQLRDKKVHSYYKIRVVYGQKPESAA